MAINPTYSQPRSANGSSAKTGGDPIQFLLRKGLIARASILARNGQWKKAEGLLIPLVSSERASMESICLLAKIYAQQGRLHEAKTLWCKAYEMDTSHSVSGTFLERCLEPVRSDYRRLISFSFAFTVLLFLVFGGFYFCFPPIREYTARLLASSPTPIESAQEKEIIAVNPESAPASQAPDSLYSDRHEKALVIDPALLPSGGINPALLTFQAETLSQKEHEPLLDASPTALPSSPISESPAPVNSMTTIADPIPQNALLVAAKTLLAENENWKELNLQIEPEGTVLTIRGEVPNVSIRDEILQGFRSIPGVSEVVSGEMKLTEVYVVRRGDKLMDIAERFYGSKSFYRKIAEANRLASPNAIQYGQTLRIPRE